MITESIFFLFFNFTNFLKSLILVLVAITQFCYSNRINYDDFFQD